MSSEKSQLKSGVIISYITLAISFVIPMVYTPIMLRILGDAEYGLYSLSSSVIGYLGLLSFGFGSTIVRYITLYQAKGEKKKEENAFFFFLALFTGIGILIMVGGVILSLSVDSIFSKGLTDAEIAKMRILMLIMAFNTAISLPVSVFSSVIISHERYLFRKLMDMVLTIAGPLSNLIMLFLGFASIGMALSSTIIQFTVLPIYIVYCIKVLHVVPRPGRIGKGIIREMVSFSFYTFLASIVDMLFWSTDKVILGMLTNTVVVAIYNIGSTFNNMVVSLSSAMSNILAPRVTTMVAKESSKSELTELFIKIGRIQFIIVSLAISGFIVFGYEFITLWAGERYSESFYVALMTLIPLSVPLIQNTGLAIVIAQNKHRFRSITYLIIAIVNVVSTYLIVPYMGAMGAALCSAISYILGQGIVMNVFYYKSIGLDVPRFWKNILKMSIIPISMMIIAFLVKKLASFSNWLALFIAVCIYSLVFIILTYFFSMNSYEKSLIKSMITSIKSKIIKPKEEV